MKRVRSVLGVLVVVTMLFTLLAPLSYAQTPGNSEGSTGQTNGGQQLPEQAQQEPPQQPVEQEQPQQPVEEELPVQEELPVEQEQPQQPVEEEHPVNQEQPQQPVQEELPVEQEQPQQPVEEELPVNQEQPQQPVQEELPVEQDLPQQQVQEAAPAEPEFEAATTSTTIYADNIGGDYECNASEWHFVINQLGNSNKAPALITVSFSDGSTVQVPLQKVTGKTAHYTHYGNLSSTVTGASAEISTTYGRFNLSHGPCPGKVTPTPVTPTPVTPTPVTPTPVTPTPVTPTPVTTVSIIGITANCKGFGTLTVSSGVAGATVTLMVTYHVPGSSDFIPTGQTTTVSLVAGQTVYTFAIDVTTGVPATANTIRVEVQSTSGATFTGTTTKSKSFGPCGTVTPTPVTPTPVTPTPVTPTPVTPTPVTPTPVTPTPGNGIERCPKGTVLVVKFENLPSSGSVTSNGVTITITGTNGDGEPTSFTFTSTNPVSQVIIKAGQNYFAGTIVPGGLLGSGSTSGQEISNIQFCAMPGKPTPVTPTPGTPTPGTPTPETPTPGTPTPETPTPGTPTPGTPTPGTPIEPSNAEISLNVCTAPVANDPYVIQLSGPYDPSDNQVEVRWSDGSVRVIETNDAASGSDSADRQIVISSKSGMHPIAVAGIRYLPGYSTGITGKLLSQPSCAMVPEIPGTDPPVTTIPVVPNIPNIPNAPVTPGEPENPGVPNIPGAPLTPGEPENPGSPNIPGAPVTLSEPEDPGSPNIPDLPAITSPGTTGETTTGATTIRVVPNATTGTGNSPVTTSTQTQPAESASVNELPTAGSGTGPAMTNDERALMLLLGALAFVSMAAGVMLQQRGGRR